MNTITNDYHGFTTFKYNGDTVLRITQFASDRFGDLRIISDMSVHLNDDEVKKLIKELQEDN